MICKYCKEESDWDGYYLNTYELETRVKKFNPKIHMVYNPKYKKLEIKYCGIEASCEIKYCPMCGKNLSDMVVKTDE